MTNEEKYLAKIAGENVVTPEPVLRKEQYLNYIANESGEIPELPVTREERYLAILAGQEYEIPAPELRIEQYMAKTCGAETEVPTPITRVEQYWAEIAENMNNTEITGTLPLTFASRVTGALKNYRIYGTAEGAGIATESGEPEGYKIPLTITGENEFDKTATNPDKGYIDGGYLISGETTVGNVAWAVSEYIAVRPGTEYVWKWRNRSSSVANPRLGIYDANYTTLRTIKYGDFAPNANHIPFTTDANAAFIRLSYEKSSDDEATFNKSSTIPIYIGDSKLGEEERVDYGEQKIYKMSEGTLVPTNPPVPFLPIPTYKGENTLSSTETLSEVTIKGIIKEAVPNG